ncbi:hypothetical protein [Algisphaera agarilytica]|uniref:Energy-coupling factor transporter ATP-binding protein EcfA2 n=1 Tax=Algisphaera agarilytica TaxID=1385975 RepID=A0A7X0H4N9_9BACT|nr:hypothetical protein [Algisphaera agarilytica]MBB6428962.1 energy-coupling factor transporter ATP-binding protein EcfA2 [Algisphaera agarilytica]
MADAKTVVSPRDNPFRSGCVDALEYASPTGESFEQIVTRVRNAGFRGALVGPHGHGKSTLMQALAELDPPADAEHHDIIQIMPDGTNMHAVKHALGSDADRLFVDGYDLLPWRLRWKLARRPGVLVTSHRETKLPTLLRCETTPALLEGLVERLSPEVCGALGHEAIMELHARHGGNIRNALRELYDRVAVGEFPL